ncbi:hypothetical protein PG984_008968 [Apiospora sp. TS-2023a]
MQLLSIAAFAAALVGVGISAEPPVPGYGVDILQWNVEVAPGQTEVLNGTVQQVYEQILQMNPDFRLGDTQLQSRGLRPQKRTSTVQCGIYDPGFTWAIQDGINYLRRVPGKPSEGPGPGNCGQVSCSYNSAIWWCNESPVTKTLKSWDMIANAAQFMLQNCDYVGGLISGQNFDSDNWSTNIGHARC